MPITKAQLKHMYENLADVFDRSARNLGQAATELYQDIIDGLPEQEQADAAENYGPGVARDERIRTIEGKLQDLEPAAQSEFASEEAKKFIEKLKNLRDILKVQRALMEVTDTFRAIARGLC
ncbi:MAG: hypothetical protein ACE5K1_03485 [Acidiferrobacterales bacterium]